jgi:uncharacterized protein YeaO (DUF488 family)
VAVKLKRAYDRPTRGDGRRVLVERLWPRGVRKAELPLDHWAKDLAPSAALRKWFGHDPARWTEFKRRYRAELAHGPAPEALEALAAEARDRTVTLVFSSHDLEHNNAVVLKETLGSLAAGPPARRRTSRPVTTRAR